MTVSLFKSAEKEDETTVQAFTTKTMILCARDDADLNHFGMYMMRTTSPF